MVSNLLLTDTVAQSVKTQAVSLIIAAAAAAKSLQSCPTLCDPIDSSPPGSPIPGILQARTLEWVAIAFSFSLLMGVLIDTHTHSQESWQMTINFMSMNLSQNYSVMC